MGRITADKGSITSIWSSRWKITSFMTRWVQILHMSRVSTLKCAVLYVAMSMLMDSIDFSVVAAVAPCRWSGRLMGRNTTILDMQRVWCKTRCLVIRVVRRHWLVSPGNGEMRYSSQCLKVKLFRLDLPNRNKICSPLARSRNHHGGPTWSPSIHYPCEENVARYAALGIVHVPPANFHRQMIGLRHLNKIRLSWERYNYWHANLEPFLKVPTEGSSLNDQSMRIWFATSE